jgi:chromosome segregation ATPase
MLDQVDQTLRAAAVLDEGRELLAGGRLVRELETGGFELLAGVSPRRSDRAEADSPPTAGRKQRLEQARGDVREARSRARETSEALRRAEREATKARRALDAAEAAAEKARREADEAAAAVERAEGELASARQR